MSDDTGLARAAGMSDPDDNVQFRRIWVEEVVTGPDAPQEPAHGATWHSASFEARRQAEGAWRRLVGGARPDELTPSPTMEPGS